MPANPEKSSVSSAARGRPAASKPSFSSGSGTPNTSSSANAKLKSRSTTASGSASKRPPRPPSASSIESSKSSVNVGGSRKDAITTENLPPSGKRVDFEDESEIKVTKLSSTTVKLQTTWTPPIKPVVPTLTPPPLVADEPTHTSDPLQVAAQAYPWMFMSSTLDACFKSAEATATNEIETLEKELSVQEEGISDQRERLEAERAIQFYDELGSDMFAKDVPAIMQLFHSHGDSCDKIERGALNLASRGFPDPNDEEPLKDYNNMLDDLERLQAEATDLSNSITKLTAQATPTTDNATADGSTKADESAARKQIISIFSACLPVLRARIANLSMAQELIDSALENASLALRMESMGLTN